MVAVPEEPPQTCIAIIKTGLQCTRLAVATPGTLCGQHQSMIDKQNQEILRLARLEQARELSDLGQQWRARREEIPGTWEHYLCTDSQFKRTLSFPQMCFMAQFLGHSYPGYASDLWRRSHPSTF